MFHIVRLGEVREFPAREHPENSRDARQLGIALELVYPHSRFSRGFVKRVPIPVDSQSSADEGSREILEIVGHLPLEVLCYLICSQEYCRGNDEKITGNC